MILYNLFSKFYLSFYYVRLLYGNQITYFSKVVLVAISRIDGKGTRVVGGKLLRRLCSKGEKGKEKMMART